MNALTFDPAWASPAQWAAMYRELGLQVVPAKLPNGEAGGSWKRPAIEWRGLTKELADDATFLSWYGPNGTFAARPNMGVICGEASDRRFIIDLDLHKNPQAKLWWDRMLHTFFDGQEPWTWSQKTGGGGRQLVFRAPAGWTPPTNKTPIGVDIRGQGGFGMFPPSLHESGRAYIWEPGRSPWELPDGPVWAPQGLCDAIDELVARTAPNALRPSRALLNAFLRRLYSTSGGIAWTAARMT
jgi:hypothetical protein